MSDQGLRELERRWRQTGLPDDEAVYLRERVRRGDLTRDRLALAAHCGHAGARQALGAPGGELDLGRWLSGLEQWGRESLLLGASELVAGLCATAGVGEPTRELLQTAERSAEGAGVRDAVGATLMSLSRHPPDPARDVGMRLGLLVLARDGEELQAAASELAVAIAHAEDGSTLVTARRTGRAPRLAERALRAPP